MDPPLSEMSLALRPYCTPNRAAPRSQELRRKSLLLLLRWGDESLFPGDALLLVSSSSFAQVPYTQEQVIAYSKSIEVQTLDPSLPSQRPEDWLQAGPPHAHVWWKVTDTCDLKPDDSGMDYPLLRKDFAQP